LRPCVDLDVAGGNDSRGVGIHPMTLAALRSAWSRKNVETSALLGGAGPT
jgi:hypothetical protein